jgi:hypothetical protein
LERIHLEGVLTFYKKLKSSFVSILSALAILYKVFKEVLISALSMRPICLQEYLHH